MITLATDRKGNHPITLAADRSRAIFVAGKRGSGKSYTLGRIIEEYHRLGSHLIVVVDPLAVFWTTALPAPTSPPLAGGPALSVAEGIEGGIPVRVIVPGDPAQVLGPLAQAMADRGVDIARLWINPSDLTADAWLALFGLTLSSPQGIALSRAVRTAKRSTCHFQLSNLIAAVESDEQIAEATRAAVTNRLDAARDWGIFADHYQPITDVLDTQAVNVVDVSAFDPGPQSIRNLVVKLLAEQLFRARFAAHRAETLPPPTRGRAGVGVPPVLLCIDEAHDFAPATGDALAKAALVRYAKEGRQPGLSLAIATQQPSALTFSLVSQCDVLVMHRLTLQDDVKVAGRLASTYAADLSAWLKGVRQPGDAIIVDDAEERVHVGRILPRRTHHGGGNVGAIHESPVGTPPPSRPVGAIHESPAGASP
jgi:hypothetical protein